MSFAANTSSRKPRRKKSRNTRARQSKRAYLFESLEDRLNLSLMFLEVEPNEDTTAPINFAGDLLAAQSVALPGASTGIVDSVTMAKVIGDSPTDNDGNPDYYTFNAAVAGAINVSVINRGGDPGGDGGADNLDVRVFRASPVDIDDTIGLANVLLVGQTYTGSFTAGLGEKFFVRVSGDGGDDDANYDLRIWNTEPSDVSGANNNSQGTAPNLGTVTVATAINTAGTITQPDRDYFAFSAGATGHVSVKITMPDGTGFPFGPGGNQPTNLGVRVRDAAGIIIATSNGTAGNVDIASFDATTGTNYFAEVYSGSFGQINSYVLDISMVGAPEGRVTGFVFQDLNQNTFKDTAELPSVGVTVNVDINNDGGVDRTAVTDANGFYTVGNLPFGTHRIFLASQPGVHAVYPEASFGASYRVRISANDLNADHIDFATVRADFGDAPGTGPNSYHTLLMDNGPRHTDRGPTLGATRDAESDGFNSPADGDDLSHTGSPDDEDGVTLPATIFQGATANITVQASAAGLLTGWIDYNRDGDFADAGEKIFNDVSVVAGPNILPIVASNSLLTGASYARFRISTQSGLSFDGPAPDGEVEDYPVNLQQNRVSIDDVTLTEGDTGIKNFVFTVSLDVASTGTIMVNYATQNGTAAAGDDYTAVGPATLTFAPGQTTRTFVVPVIGDITVEPDETFVVNLSGITGPAVAGDISGQGTILNDDFTNLSIDDVMLNEGNVGQTDFVFTVTLTKPASTTITVDYATSDGTATTGNNDYTAIPVAPVSTLTFNPGETSKTITVKVTGDTAVEPNETFNVDLSNVVGAVTAVTKSQGVGTILNDDSPMFSVSDFSALEGDTGSQTFSFNVTLSAAATSEVRVDYKTTDATATTADLDYVGVPLTTLIFAIGETSKTVTVQVNGDTKDEADETFTVDLSNVLGPATILDGQGIGSILNDDSTRISISDVTQNEGDSGDTDFVFTVSLSNVSAIPVTVDYRTMDGTALVSDNDYTAIPAVPVSTLTFNPGQTSKTVTVKVKGDTAVEADETFTVELSNATGASILDGSGLGTILNDDSTVISVADVNRLEGDSGLTGFVFTIVLSRPSTTSVFVDYHTVDGTATLADLDYNQLITTTHEFLPGETMYDVTVNVNGDTKVEANETFRLILSNPVGDATIADNDAVGTIQNDDGTGFSINNASVVETDSGTVMMSFDITLSNASTGTHSVTYQTSNGTATTADNDYVAAGPTVVTFNPGVTTQTIMITVNGDTNIEDNETFNVNLSNPTGGATIADGLGVGTILSDDLATLSIDDVMVLEGNPGDTNMLVFTVTRSTPNFGPATVAYTTNNGTATLADNDYTDNDGVLNFAAGENSKTISVAVTGDLATEADETVTILLGATTGLVTVANGTGTGTIKNDDSPVISINDVTMNEGLSGTTSFTFNVTLDRTSVNTITVTAATSDGTATIADNDYQQLGATVVTFTPGQTSMPVTVLVNGDAFVEGNETFNVNLTLPTGGAAIGDALGVGTITNDDNVEITGTKTDTLGNPIAGVTFELYNDDGAFPGVFNPASPFATNPTGVDTLRQTTVTGADGRYNFGAALPAGTYYIREIPSAGWYQIAPATPNNFITVAYDGVTPVNVDAPFDVNDDASPDGPFVNARCADNHFETSANLGQTLTATRAGIMTIEVIGDAGVSFAVNSNSGNVTGLNASLVKVSAASFASRSSGTNRARVDLVLTAADVGKTFSISSVQFATSPTLLIANSVFVDPAKVLIVRGSNCGDVVFVRDDPNSGGANSDAKHIFFGSYSGSLSEFNTGVNLVGKFSGVTYNAAIINASFDSPIISSVQIFGGDGNDIIRIAREISQDSVIDAGNGDDIVRSGAGRSTVYGGDGSDFIVGGLENDVLYGDAGDDFIHGRGGGDRIFGGNGNDVLSGGEGDDPLIRGGNGNDIISGGTGRDRLIGDAHDANPPGDIAYVEKSGSTSIDILVMDVETQVIVNSGVFGPLGNIVGDVAEENLLKLIERFWADNNIDSDTVPDTLDEIIAQLLP